LGLGSLCAIPSWRILDRVVFDATGGSQSQKEGRPRNELTFGWDVLAVSLPGLAATPLRSGAGSPLSRALEWLAT
jgi:hypothetical protein